MPANFHLVSENIYRGGTPSIKDLQLLSDTYNIKRIISLDANIANNINPIVEHYNMEHIIIPLSASETSMTSNIKYLINNINILLDGSKPTYIHCKLGKDRTGLAIALYRIKHDNWTSERAFAEAKKFGFGAGISVQVQNFYKKIIFGFTEETSDVNSADDSIIQNMRFNFDNGEMPPEQTQSLAPYGFLPSQKELPIYNRNDDPHKKRMDELSKIRESIPIIGQETVYTGQAGFGGSIGFLSEEFLGSKYD